MTLCNYILYADSSSEALLRILSCKDLHVACLALPFIQGNIASRPHRVFAQETYKQRTLGKTSCQNNEIFNIDVAWFEAVDC